MHNFILCMRKESDGLRFISKIYFFAGMCTFQNGEPMSSFFDGYVLKQTSLKEFFDMYEIVLQKKHKKEAVNDLES